MVCLHCSAERERVRELKKMGDRLRASCERGVVFEVRRILTDKALKCVRPQLAASFCFVFAERCLTDCPPPPSSVTENLACMLTTRTIWDERPSCTRAVRYVTREGQAGCVLPPLTLLSTGQTACRGVTFDEEGALESSVGQCYSHS